MELSVSLDFFYCRPVLVDDVVPTWRASDWTREFLCETYGQERVVMKGVSVCEEITSMLHRGVQPTLSQWCISNIPTPPISTKFLNVPLYFHKISKFPPIFVKFACFLPNLCFLLPPILTMMHLLRSGRPWCFRCLRLKSNICWTFVKVSMYPAAYLTHSFVHLFIQGFIWHLFKETIQRCSKLQPGLLE